MRRRPTRKPGQCIAALRQSRPLIVNDHRVAWLPVARAELQPWRRPFRRTIPPADALNRRLKRTTDIAAKPGVWQPNRRRRLDKARGDIQQDQAGEDNARQVSPVDHARDRDSKQAQRGCGRGTEQVAGAAAVAARREWRPRGSLLEMVSALAGERSSDVCPTSAQSSDSDCSLMPRASWTLAAPSRWMTATQNAWFAEGMSHSIVDTAMTEPAIPRITIRRSIVRAVASRDQPQAMPNANATGMLNGSACGTR